MDRKKLALLGGAVVVAMATALAARSMFAGAATPQAVAVEAPQPTGPRVLVARRALPVGTIISADAVSFQPWPSELVQDAYFTEGDAPIDKLLGTVVRHPVTAGEPVTQGSLVKPGDRGFLAAALGPGMRAVTVDVSARTGVAGFVFPGDRVDIILTQSVSGEGQPLRATETIMRNVRVLATDQSTASTTEDGKTVVQTFRTATLEVTPRMAEKIAVAETIGTLSLSLRSIADSQGELDQALASGEIELPAGATPEQEERLLRAAATRPQDARGSFVTGGDVSRFQRSSMPRTESSGESPQSGAPAAAPVRAGPVVRVTRGQTATLVQVPK
ncbi:Flp pilus assembly protein CpaB [Croceibacterium sp. TMG7-5b_MA50]|uniref:Flp pilus assembly protein CpaB n=1 Tax=Croceibacterium sp. TMG7-5b_MA50 TaxID=3121290 RepID=UPI00322202AA